MKLRKFLNNIINMILKMIKARFHVKAGLFWKIRVGK